MGDAGARAPFFARSRGTSITRRRSRRSRIWRGARCSRIPPTVLRSVDDDKPEVGIEAARGSLPASRSSSTRRCRRWRSPRCWALPTRWRARSASTSIAGRSSSAMRSPRWRARDGRPTVLPAAPSARWRPTACGTCADEARRVPRARRDPGLVVLEGFHAVKHACASGRAPRRLDRRRRRAAGAARAAGARPRAVADRGRAPGARRGRPARPGRGRRAPPAPARPRRHPGPGGPGAGDPARGPAPPRQPRRVRTGRRGRGRGRCDHHRAADPWHPDALRGSAGLHFALPVAARA